MQPGLRDRRSPDARRVTYEPAFATLNGLIGDLAGLEGDSDQTTALLGSARRLREELRQALRAKPATLPAVTPQLRILARPVGRRASALTPREAEVLSALARGRANKQIALDLGISARTVRNHISAIYEKLGVGARAEAAVAAIRLGLISG